MDIRLKVSPDQLVRRAGEMQGSLGRIRTTLDGLASSWDSCHQSWEGETARRHISLEKQLQQEAYRLLQQMEKWPEQICTMAGVYKKAEAASSEEAAMLPEDVIV